MVNHKDLEILLLELSELTSKSTWTKQDERRNAFLLAAVSAVKSGASLRSIDQERLNDKERAVGLPLSRIVETPDLDERRAAAKVWQRFCSTGEIEQRDEAVGNGKPNYLQGSLGSFVDRSWFAGLSAAMKWMDPLVDPAVVTMIETEGGNPLQVGMWDDTTEYASVIGENTNESSNESDLTGPYAVDLQAFSYRTQPLRASIESFTDIDQMVTLIDLFQKFSAARISRGVGRDLLTGNGNGKTLGLLPTLELTGACEGAVASGSSESTGGSQTGVNSIGDSDIANLYFSVDEAYRQSPKCAFLANDSTKSLLSRTLDKYGRPLIEIVNGRSVLFGKPFLTSPSMPSIASAAIPLVFGDFSYWYTRHATAGDRVQLLKESYADKGQVGLRTYQRWDGALAWSGSVGSNPPLKYLICHS